MQSSITPTHTHTHIYNVTQHSKDEHNIKILLSVNTGNITCHIFILVNQGVLKWDGTRLVQKVRITFIYRMVYTHVK